MLDINEPQDYKYGMPGGNTTLLSQYLDFLVRGIGASSGSLIILDDEGQILDAALAYRGEIHSPMVNQVAEVVEQGLAGWVVEHGQHALIEDTLEDSRWIKRPWDQDNGSRRSALSIPLMDDKKVHGVLTLVQDQNRRFTNNDLMLLSATTVGIPLLPRLIETN
jgi:GAF domain-containing protein